MQETYKGVSEYIYKVEQNETIQILDGIPDVFYSYEPVQVASCEFIKDAYYEILQAYDKDEIDIIRYEDWTKKQRESNRRMILKEYETADNHPEYEYFLQHKFLWLKN